MTPKAKRYGDLTCDVGADAKSARVETPTILHVARPECVVCNVRCGYNDSTKYAVYTLFDTQKHIDARVAEILKEIDDGYDAPQTVKLYNGRLRRQRDSVTDDKLRAKLDMYLRRC